VAYKNSIREDKPWLPWVGGTCVFYWLDHLLMKSSPLKKFKQIPKREPRVYVSSHISNIIAYKNL
jgi:hypothetical protein